MAEVVNSYITLVRATEDEIKKDYNDHINGRIIFDKTNKTISVDEKDQRYIYSGKSTSEAFATMLPFNWDEIKTSSAKALKHFGFTRQEDFRSLEGKVYLTNDGVLCIMKDTRFVKTTVEELVNTKYTFELKGSDLYITQNF